MRHFIELRRRALSIVFVFSFFFLIFYGFSPFVFHHILAPLLHALPKTESLMTSKILTAFFMPIQVAANLAFFCTVPFVLQQMWCFISPALYDHERSPLAWMMVGSMVLFCLGALFCFYVVLPLMFSMLVKAVPLGVRLMPDMGYAMDFIIHMLLLFGFSFQVPLLCVFFVRVGVVQQNDLKMLRPYVIVLAFILGMLLTPPDVVSQLMLAIPLCALYELGIFCARKSVNNGYKSRAVGAG